MPRAAGPTSHRRLAVWLFSVAVGTNVPTPLLLLYRERLDMSSSLVTALFGVYAAGLVPALVFAGPAADRFGRRNVALPAAALAGVVSALFVLAADSVPLLFGARWLQGVVSGTVFSVGSAWISETSPGRGARTAAVAMTAGFSLGPLTSGLLGEFGPAPTALSYLLHVGVVVVGLAVVAPVGETLAKRAVGVKAPSGNPLRAGAGWEALTVVAPLAVCVYAFPASAINAVPLLVGLPAHPVAATGVLAGATLGAGTLVAPLQARLGRLTAAYGAGLGAVGFGLATLGAAGPRLLLLPAAVLMGAGGGLALAAGLSRLPALAREGRLATVSSGFYASAYLGFATPFLLAEVSKPLGIVLPLGVLAALFGLLSLRQAYSAA
ncbi:MAG: major facilitator superfamily 1 [Frankiales bacterium]|nr:major facilitator superfamily 1 [Frankiales bacterium]